METATCTPDAGACGPRRRIAVELRRWATRLCELAFPPSCAFCEAELDSAATATGFCDDCEKALFSDAGPRCVRCAARIPDVAAPQDRCRHCPPHRARLDRALCLGAYEDDLRGAVLQMKRSRSTTLALAVGRVLARHVALATTTDPPDLVVPVPMHWSRRIVRGINSAELLAESVSAQLGLPLLSRLLVRSRNTLPQFELPPRERFRNVRGAFRARVGYDLTDARVLLIDDILTTGATASDAARALRECGAAAVTVAVAARAESLAG